MGTRHLICVVLQGQFKIAQYGQWDGYPLGAGADVVHFIISGMRKTMFCDALKECSFYSAEELRVLAKEHEASVQLPPELSRDTGSDILALVQDKGIRRLVDSSEFAGDSLFCEWAYVLDMDKDILEVYQGFNTRKVAHAQRFASMPINSAFSSKYKQVRFLVQYPFDQLTDTTMKELDAEIEAANNEKARKKELRKKVAK